MSDWRRDLSHGSAYEHEKRAGCDRIAFGLLVAAAPYRSSKLGSKSWDGHAQGQERVSVETVSTCGG
jgi:hypothetical protein